MSNGRRFRCRGSVHHRERAGVPEVCDECGQDVPDDQVAVLVAWIDTPAGSRPDWAFVGHPLCALLVSSHLEQAHGLPTVLDDDGSWLRKAAGF